MSAIRISQVVAFSRTHSVHLNPRIEGTENACPQFSGGRFCQVVARTGSTVHTKTGMLFGQHFDGGPPRNLNHVFLRQFGNGFNKKIGMFMFKNQNDGATLISQSSD